MAASAGPRPGWSRRAQYSLFFSFLAVIAGLIVGVILLILSLAAPKSYAAVRGAASLSAQAGAGEIVIGAATGRRAEGYVEVESLASGADDAGTRYRLIGRPPLRLRWEVRAARGLTRFVGRDDEMDRLAAMLDRAARGSGTVGSSLPCTMPEG